MFATLQRGHVAGRMGRARTALQCRYVAGTARPMRWGAQGGPCQRRLMETTFPPFVGGRRIVSIRVASVSNAVSRSAS